METFEVKIINPKAVKLLKGLEELRLISIKDSQKEHDTALEKRSRKPDLQSAGKNQETCPFRPQFLTFNGVNYILREKLDTTVLYEDGQYIISNEPLNITVWGKTREEAEEAFAFAFHSLYENFAKEHDKYLSRESRVLKQTLKKLIVK